MNTSFSKIIKAGDRMHEFNFRQLSGSENKYHVDVPDGKGNRIIFYMYQDDKGNWKPSDKLPAWIESVEEHLSKAIHEESGKIMAKRKSI